MTRSGWHTKSYAQERVLKEWRYLPEYFGRGTWPRWARTTGRMFGTSVRDLAAHRPKGLWLPRALGLGLLLYGALQQFTDPLAGGPDIRAYT